MRLFSRLKEGLKKTRDRLQSGLSDIFSFTRKIDDDLLDEIEELLYTADIGAEEVDRVITDLREAYREKRIEDTDQLREYLKEELKAGLLERDASVQMAPAGPTVILVVGVNGSGKTTSIAKLGKYFKDDGKEVLFAACDTFRAAAVEQLQIWGERLGIPVVRHNAGSDPAAVAFDATQAAISREVDVLLIDTAGRLHTKEPLMRELDKIVRVIKRLAPEAPHETLLVLDATLGQNSIAQAKTFKKVVGLSGIVLAKLDGTAKGGSILAINRQLRLPVKFIGLGEKPDDFEPFDAAAFVEALFEK